MPEMPPFSPTVALLAIAASWDAVFAETLKPLGLTARKYALLGHIRATPGISFSELARRSRITTPAAHGIVAAFVVDELVTDTTARAGAASHLEVTAGGERLLAEVSSRVAALDAQFAATHPALATALRTAVGELISNPSTFK